MFIKALIMWFKVNKIDKAYKWGDWWFDVYTPSCGEIFVHDTIIFKYIKNNPIAIYKFAKKYIKEA